MDTEARLQERIRELELENEQLKAKHLLLVQRRQLELTCAHCSASLLEDDQPPRCLDCSITEEDEEAWFKAFEALGDPDAS